MVSRISVGVPRGSTSIVYVNRTLYILLIYIINSRLEADINRSVGFLCVTFRPFHHTCINCACLSTRLYRYHHARDQE